MDFVSRADIGKSLSELGIAKGDMVIVHSSFKSLGNVDGGAETVIGGFFDVIGGEGTLVMPTFVQKDFEHAYETWHIDKDSDTGYLTNYFRKRKGSIRSDQATHSVAASGRLAGWLTETHGHTCKRYGNMGDTPFSADSPWEKMYQSDAKIVLLGVGMIYTTFRHYAEYVYIEKCLKRLENTDEYENMKKKLCGYNKPGAWPHVCNEWVGEKMEEKGLVKKSRCKNAALTSFSSREFVDLVLQYLTTREPGVLWEADDTWIPKWNEWIKEFDEITNKNKDIRSLPLDLSV